jgi:hypothetical protein
MICGMHEPTASELETYRKVRDWIDAQRADWKSAHLTRQDSLRAIVESAVPLNRNRGWYHAWSDYEWGYFFAATALVGDYANKHEGESLVYPILFLYRHYVELKLKSVLMEAAASLHCELPTTTADEHNLNNLWQMLLDLLRQHRRSKMLKGCESVERVLDQLTQIDPHSMESRYALEKDLETPTFARLNAIDLQNFQGVMTKLRTELDGVEMLFQYVDECWWDEEEPVDTAIGGTA